MEPENSDMPIMSANVEDISGLNEGSAYFFVELNEAFYKTPYESLKDWMISSKGNLVVDPTEDLGTVSMGGSV